MVTKQDLLDGLVSYWKFDETSGTIAVDSHGSNDGDIVGAIINQDGQIGRAYSFDGENDYVEVSDNLDLVESSSFTIGAWIKTSSSTGNNGILGHGVSMSSGETSGFQFTLEDNNLRIFYLNTASPSTVADIKGGTINTDTWHHVMVVYDSSNYNVKLYIDNSEVADDTHSFGIETSSSYVKIGAWGRSGAVNPFDGLIDEVAVWNRALSSDEVSTLYDIQKDGNESGSYPFNALSLKIKGTTKKQGTLIQGAKVSCINQNTNELVGHTNSDENGEWEFSDLVETDKYHVVGSLEDGEKFNHLSYYDIEPKEEE